MFSDVGYLPLVMTDPEKCQQSLPENTCCCQMNKINYCKTSSLKKILPVND